VQQIGRRRFIGAAAGAIALGAAGGIALGHQQWFDPDETAGQEVRPIAADPQATADAQALLAWFRQLPGRTAKRVVSIEKLAKRTRKYPAMVGVMFREAWGGGASRFDPEVLIDHWHRGGLITMDMHPTNPWNPVGGPDSAWVPDAKVAKPDLRALLATSDTTPQRTLWRTQLEKLGDLVEELNSAGVVVLLRPLHECNGSWFWWGQDMATRKTFARDLYRDVFFYITQTRKLHNVIWVYSPGASWDGPALSYYPGAEYVDMICPTRYDDELLMLGERSGESKNSDYKDIISAGKPVGFGECGPSTKLDGSWDARTIIKRIRENYPAMTYFHVWHGWQGKIMELVKDRHTEELMNDPWVITRENIDWRPKTGPTTSSPRPTGSQPSSTPPGGSRPSSPTSTPPILPTVTRPHSVIEPHVTN
jgi:mannan endo-1,4-beta-mannosidase